MKEKTKKTKKTLARGGTKGRARASRTASKCRPPRGSIHVGRWNAKGRQGTVITMTPAGRRWWLTHVPMPTDDLLDVRQLLQGLASDDKPPTR